MQFLTLFLTSATLATAALNTTQEFLLKTSLKAGQSGKEAFDGLYLQSYHTGAGLNDVVFTDVQSSGVKGFLNATNETSSTSPYYNALFDLGGDYAYGLEMAESVVAYTSWQPVRMNIGESGTNQEVNGFFLNETGLQWTSSTGAFSTGSSLFGGWLVCDWWHGEPQLFFRNAYYDTPAPSSCADVLLEPVYTY